MSKSIQLKKGTEKYYVHPYFPVGSIYMNITNINPSTYFGGTWERLKDKFLLAVGDTYKENTTGGSASVTLTTDQIPAHAHGLNSHTHSVGAHSHGLNEHVHSVGAHAHGLNSHTHTYAKSNANTGSFAITAQHLPVSAVVREERTNSAGNHNWASGLSGWGNYENGYGKNDRGQGHSHTISTTSTNSGAASGNTANSTAFNSGKASGNTANSTAFNSGAASGNTANAGGGKSHTNMPPYITVYVWKRTA